MMKTINEKEARSVEGGAWVGLFAKACAYARLMYEHAAYGSCRTRYYGWGLTCPVCGKYTP